MKNVSLFAYFFIFLFLSLLISCGSETKNSSGQTKSDSSSVQTYPGENAETKKLFSHFKPNDQFPFVADTAFMKNVMSGDSLGAKEVKQLAVSWFSNSEINAGTYLLDEFYTIDSVKASGTFAKWAESLEIGNIKFANAYALRQLKLDEHASVLVWALTYQSYEACPYSSGTEVYYTIVNDGKISESFLLGEDVSGADAPASMSRTITGTLDKDGKIILDSYEEDDDDIDNPTITVQKSSCELKLSGGKTVSVSEKKEEPKKIARRNARKK